MRVAIITENFLPKIDGVTRTLAKMLDLLHAHGHEAIVCGPRGSPARHGPAPVLPIPGVPLPLYPELRILAPWALPGRKLADFAPDVLHLSDPMLLGPAALYWAQRLQVPVVASYHTNLAQYARYFGLGCMEGPLWAYRRRIHNGCAVTLCPSPSIQRMLNAHGFQRAHVWPHGVDTDLFSPARRVAGWRTRLGADERTHLLLYVGRLSHEKNIRLLADAYRALARPDVRLVVVGDGPARAEMEESLCGLPVTFTGYLQGEALATTFASADLLLFPSMTETFGLVTLEAMASGLPVVACWAHGAVDIVRDGVTGLLTYPYSVSAYARAVDALLADPARRAEMGRAARAEATRYSWEDALDRLLLVYQQAIHCRGARTQWTRSSTSR